MRCLVLKFQNFPYEASNITGSPNFVCPQNVQVEIFDFKVLKVFVIRMKILFSSDILNRFITGLLLVLLYFYFDTHK